MSLDAGLGSEDAPNDTAPDAIDAADATDAGLDVACPEVCAVGSAMCEDGGLVSCTLGPSGCPAWGPPSACGPRQSCVTGDAGGGCVCQPSACAEAGSSCSGDPPTATSCVADSNGCLYVASTTQCPGDPNGTPACVNGACGFSCAPGYHIVGGTCSLLPPLQIAPLSTATVTSQKPTLRWSLADGLTGAQVDICADRACANVVATFVATGSSGAPLGPLARGVYFWRARGMVDGTVGTETSATWELFVGAGSAPVDTSFGTVLDVNGDGYADLAVGEGDGLGVVEIFLGSAAGLSVTPTATIMGPDDSSVGSGTFGDAVASAGDVNGDGYVDLLVGAWDVNAEAGRAYLYFGGTDSLFGDPLVVDPPAAGSMDFGARVAGAGDVDGDGYADYMVSDASGHVAVYSGGTSPSTTPVALLPTGLGAGDPPPAGVGDVDGDGLADLALAGVDDVSIYLGSQGTFPMQPASVIVLPADASGRAVPCAALVSELDSAERPTRQIRRARLRLRRPTAATPGRRVCDDHQGAVLRFSPEASRDVDRSGASSAVLRRGDDHLHRPRRRCRSDDC